jgi:hypothetical protein
MVRVGARVGPGGLPTCGEWIRASGQLLVSAAHVFASSVRWRVRRWSPPPLQYPGRGTQAEEDGEEDDDDDEEDDEEEQERKQEAEAEEQEQEQQKKKTKRKKNG